jgi:hypothetical protein
MSESENYCENMENKIYEYDAYSKCADTVAFYLFSSQNKYEQNTLFRLDEYECGLYIKNKKIIYINNKCPVSCNLFD